MLKSRNVQNRVKEYLKKLEIHIMFMDSKLKIVKISVLSIQIYRHKAIPINFQEDILYISN